MTLSIFLHLYQPADQMEDILEMVTKQSYRPVLQGLQKHKAKVTVNVIGSLLELFDKYKYYDVLDSLRDLHKSGVVEFTGSAKYHAFLPLIPQEEIYRQIKMNTEALKFFIGADLEPKGFFPPEMGYNNTVAKVVEELGYNWIIIDEIAGSYLNGDLDPTANYKIKGTNLFAYFRDRRISNLIMSSVIRSKAGLVDAIKEDLKVNKYMIAGMDGETFGHHRPGLENFLFEILQSTEFDLKNISELKAAFPNVKEIEVVDSTWASSKNDIDRKQQFLSWLDPTNIIHSYQWEFLKFVTNEVYSLDKALPYYQEVRKKLDKAMASDHFWWASAKPWWGMDMIEYGAHLLLETIMSIPNLSSEKVNQTRKYYEDIISTAFTWQRSGLIRKMAKDQNAYLRIPFKDRTLGVGGAESGVYFAFIDMMRNLEKQAAANGEYEKAILWRDAVYKLENKSEIYDTINALDLLRLEIPNEYVEKIIGEYKEKYKQIRGGQPEQRGA
ncbi:MAG TPA: polysaccharide deacetylase family protein [Candidatus Saccharimonadales bacterium]|nr:polysaccharide deacetylase family protein [Candidatus Saccharimonadales bacterium]